MASSLKTAAGMMDAFYEGRVRTKVHCTRYGNPCAGCPDCDPLLPGLPPHAMKNVTPIKQGERKV